MFYYVYVLRAKNSKLYIGFTADLKRRFVEHNRKENKSTAPYAPWQIAYFEAHRNEDDAKRREKYLKTSQGAWAIKRMLREQLKQVF